MNQRQTTIRLGRRTGWFGFGLAAVLGWAGCANQPRFPAPISTYQENGNTVFAFDTNKDKSPDFWQFQGPDGRKTAIAYAGTTGLPILRIELDQYSPSDYPHFVLVLDGVPFEVVEELYREGRFRFFHPPSRVICCFPSMTDTALTDLFHAGRCIAYEASYFDHEANAMSDGNEVYFSGRNAPWTKRVAYRCSVLWDMLVYINPQAVFNHELNQIWKVFQKAEEGRVSAYSVGTAGLGTRGGRDAIRAYLMTIDRFCEQLIHDRRGRLNITLMADHGHNLVENQRVSFKDVLEQSGYRVTKTLSGPNDVVEIAYGLVTFASFCTDDPAGVARCLLDHPDAELAIHRDGDAAIVLSVEGEGRIRKSEGGYRYEYSGADPLRLTAILDQLSKEGKISADGDIDSDALFLATVEHEFPDPLERIWIALFELVDEPPDVVVSLRDGASHGSAFFEKTIGDTASTHGSLNRMNSTTFVMSMLGELPPALRSREVFPALRRFFRPARNVLDEKVGQ